MFPEISTEMSSKAPSSEMLRDLAKEFKGKLSSCLIYDANVCTTRPVPGRPWELDVLSGEPFTEQMNFTQRGRKVTVLANSVIVNGSAAGTFASRPFSINAKQMIAFRSQLACTLSIDALQYPVFTEDGTLSSEQGYVLDRPELRSLVAQTDFEQGESIYFTRGEIGFYLSEFAVALLSAGFWTKSPTWQNVSRPLKNYQS
jgi:hypothetical protein